MFFNFLDNFSYSEHIPVYVLKGTKTHDYNQLDSFFDKTLVNPYFHIINTVTVEEILPNFNVLFLPEEYMEDQDAYYKEYKKKSNTYDMIIGHGTWDVFAFENQITESERNIKGSPVFKYKEWENRVHGNIIFGHIHVHNVHKKLIYPGSFDRWCFGEATEKGFIYHTYNTRTKKTSWEFIENDLARIYETVKASNIFKGKATLEEKVAALKKIKNSNDIRIDMDIDMSTEDIAIMKNIVASKENIKLSVQTKKLVADTEEEDDKYAYLEEFPTIESQIQAWISHEKGIDLTIDDIREDITEDSKDVEEDE